MTPEQFNENADAIQAQLEIFRLLIWAFIGTVAFLAVLAGGALAAIEAEQHYKREALINQEARATWVK